MLNTITSHQETDDQEGANTGKLLLADSDPEFPESLSSIDPAILDMSTDKGSLNDHLQKLIQENQGISSTLQLSLSGYMPEQDQVFSADPATIDMSETMNMLREHLLQANLTQLMSMCALSNFKQSFRAVIKTVSIIPVSMSMLQLYIFHRVNIMQAIVSPLMEGSKSLKTATSVSCPINTGKVIATISTQILEVHMSRSILNRCQPLRHLSAAQW